VAKETWRGGKKPAERHIMLIERKTSATLCIKAALARKRAQSAEPSSRMLKELGNASRRRQEKVEIIHAGCRGGFLI
jgi:hypothetical protein